MSATIRVLGLGAGDLDQLPLGIYREIKEATYLFLRTKEHPVVSQLEAEGIQFTAFDGIYEERDTFEEVYNHIVDRLMTEADKHQLIVYAVPGHPLVAERTVQLLLEKKQHGLLDVEVKGGQSFLDPLFARLAIDPIDGFALLDATSLTSKQVNPLLHNVIAQVYDQLTASDVKLTLMELYPDEYAVTVATAVGINGMEVVETIPLYELDRVTHLGNLSLVYVPPTHEDAVLNRQFSQLKEIIAVLRGPDGCPWDRKQTHHSLRKYLLEEAYEVVEAIDADDPDALSEELGDLLLQIMLHSQIASETGDFTVEDVIEKLSEKMIRRHPHVFGEGKAENADEVVANWNQIKEQEKAEKGLVPFQSKLEGIPRDLPSLMFAQKLQKKAAEVGFDWDKVADVHKKIEEEYQELKQAAPDEQKGELGDLLFAIINLARFLKIDAEEALAMTNRKFKKRFSYIEEKLQVENRSFAETSLEEMDRWWEEAKKREREGV